MKGQIQTQINGLINEGKTHEAIEMLRRLITSTPDDDGLYYLMGNIHRSRSEWKEALECYNTAIEYNPESKATAARTMLLSILEYYCKDNYNP